MAIERKSKPQWAEEFLEEASKPVPPDVLKRRQRAMDWIRANRIDIRPDTVSDYIRAIREDEDEDDD
ncbi:MAG: hypothetical protein HYY03_08180 [Chloroflexi bacterium]|nr:hypothetical protein [Chloroflexota bacterium]